jgi:hypothetical protein
MHSRRAFTQGNEENEDPSGGQRKPASLPSFPSVGLYWVKKFVKKKVLTVWGAFFKKSVPT